VTLVSSSIIQAIKEKEKIGAKAGKWEAQLKFRYVEFQVSEDYPDQDGQ
jgi:hypothetical protein